MLDEPHGITETFNMVSGGWTAAPLVGNVIKRIGPLLGIVPTNENENEFKELMLEYWDLNLTKVFTKKRDIQIADAILELFRRSQYIENFNKKH